MHRELKKLLKKATGKSEFAIAVTVDIRDFSSFAGREDSTGVAEFIKRFYLKLISKYFPKARYFKPMGDGLLIIYTYTEGTLRKVTNEIFQSCLNLVSEFSSICAGDEMINFDVPDRVGIGISRGSVCCLVSGDKILDYSGRCLNLSARLMDLARPSGIVFDGGFGLDILSDELKGQFEKDNVFVKGIAEIHPIEIYYAKEHTMLPLRLKRPLKEIEWETINDTKTLKQIKSVKGKFLYLLRNKPLDPNSIAVKVEYQKVLKGKKVSDMTSIFPFSDFEYILEGDEPTIKLRFDLLAERLVKRGIKNNWNVIIRIKYPIS